jgi:hypothetical protein
MPDRARRWSPLASCALAALLGVLIPLAAAPAVDVGRIKVARGTAWVERGGTRLPAQIGLRIQESDVIATGADGSLGITFADDSLLSVGPNSVVAIERFAFDPTTHRGGFDSTLRTGTLAVVSGKLARQSPDAMKVRTPSAVLGVRGTEFLVRAGTALE